MRLILIRHADSLHRQQDLIASSTACPGLTETGLQQAARLKQRLVTTGEAADCAALLVSPALRARQTAATIAPALPVSEIEELAGLAEIDTGTAEGSTWAAYHQQYGKFSLAADPHRPFAPGGESWSEYLERVHSVHLELAARFTGQTVVVVTHAGWIVAGLLSLLAIPHVNSRARIETSYTGITEWQVARDSAGRDRWQLARFNDCAHLYGSAYLQGQD